MTNPILRTIWGTLSAIWLALAVADGSQLFVAGKGGIFILEFDESSGLLTTPIKAAEVTSPSFLAPHPEKPFLYCTNNDGDREARTSSHLVSFLVASGELIELSSVETGGSTSAFVEVDQRGRFAFVANYRWGSVAGFRLEPDGRIGLPTVIVRHEGSGTVLPRQAEPHPHAVCISPDNRFAYVPDLGTDDVFVYQINHFDGTLSSGIEAWCKAGEGAGPRHMAFHPAADVVYAINELNSTVSVFKRNPDLGALTASQTISALPKGYAGSNASAHIRVHPNGRWVYGSNRGHDSIVVYEALANGFLRLAGHHRTGKTPRHFAIDPSGKWLIAGNQGDGTLTVFAIDQDGGGLTATDAEVEVPGPVCLVFSP